MTAGRGFVDGYWLLRKALLNFQRAKAWPLGDN
jgi:hypothetical protein